MFRKGVLLVLFCLSLVGAHSAFATDQSSVNYRNIGPTFAPTVKDISSASYLMTASIDAIVGSSLSSHYDLRSGVPINDTNPVAPPVCGNGILESGESCDNGINNGVCPRTCSSSCTINSCGGIGGGGGAEPPAASSTSVTFRGRAYPLSRVTVLKDGQIAITTIAGPDAMFDITLTGLSSGTFTFSLYSESATGRRSSLFTFPVVVTQGANTTVSGIFLSPTIEVDKEIVKHGDIVQIFGQAAPTAAITIQVNSEPVFVNADSDASGVYLYAFNTGIIELGDHTTKSSASIGGAASAYSPVVGFLVNETGEGPPKPACGRADLNCDGKVNLVDFSIAAFWYKRALSAAFSPIEVERLNGDGKIDLVDFSIMAYYWTG
ncbi:hypothetical protein IT087_02090 [Candidatus Uhrbacteria bacterium]|nr:hypothetical protein [Candidatus Uhrbacteria bacterium]